jgi:hypothetical protein
MANIAAEFWSAFQIETVEKLENRGEGHCFRAPENGEVHEGLITLTTSPFGSSMLQSTKNRGWARVALPNLRIGLILLSRAIESIEKTYIFAVEPASALIAALACCRIGTERSSAKTREKSQRLDSCRQRRKSQ